MQINVFIGVKVAAKRSNAAMLCQMFYLLFSNNSFTLISYFMFILKREGE